MKNLEITENTQIDLVSMIGWSGKIALCLFCITHFISYREMLLNLRNTLEAQQDQSTDGLNCRLRREVADLVRKSGIAAGTWIGFVAAVVGLSQIIF